MPIPVQIAVKNVEESPELRDLVNSYAAKLEKFYDRIMSCRVVIDCPHRHHERGNRYQIRIDLKVPGDELVVKHDSADDAACADLKIAVRSAFDSLQRQLEDFERRQRGDVKAHVE